MCGARLSAPPPDGSAATEPAGTTPAVVPLPTNRPDGQNVVYLNDEAARTGGAIPPNRHAGSYDGVHPPMQPPGAPTGPVEPPVPLHPQQTEPPGEDEVAELRRRAAELQASLPAFGSHGPVPMPEELVPPPRVNDNPFGDFFADGPSAWLEDDGDEESVDEVELDRPRIVGTLLAGGAVLMLLAAWTVWGIAMYRGAGGAEAGGFLLLSMLLWIWYLSLDRPRQHAAMLRWHLRMRRLVDRRVEPLRERTEGQLHMRRERDRYRAMGDERQRRITALGEGSYRAFRQGTLPAELHPAAQRVLAMERQMLVQDQRIHRLVTERAAGAAPEGHAGTEPASGTPD